MTTELEDALARELDAVAGGIDVPPMPQVGAGEEPHRRAARLLPPLLAAAAVLLVAGVLAVLLHQEGGGAPEPAPAPPRPAPTLSTDAPTVPYVIDRQLWVGGARVPGEWWYVESRGAVWIAQQSGGSWWWGGPGVEAQVIEAQIEQSPAISPDGRYVAFVDVSSGEARLTGFDTSPAGEGLGVAPRDLPMREDGVAIRVRAVTNDADVIVQGTRTGLMWRALFEDQRTFVDLNDTAPDQVVLEGTAAGLVVVDGSDGATDATSTAPYLASISTDGVLTEEGPLPTYDDLAISPGGAWLLRSPPGTLGGEVTTVSTLLAQPVAGGDEVVLTAPEGGGFGTGSWTWEDDETFVAVLVPAGAVDESDARMVRCSVTLGQCRPVTSPRAGAGAPGGPGSPEQALDAVVRAAAAGDRTSLLDPAVIVDAAWEQLVGYAAGGPGSSDPCRDNGQGTRDCEITFEADPETPYYAILEPTENAYGWRVTYVGIGGA